MNKQNYTIGMAGHIDHGKTELVKALTGVHTDRLKEEKERKISIELGYAPLYENENISVSIIDVPGHEKFIRQMIAGVSSIDLNLLIVAADEGVMPQTLEHLEILTHLDINNGIVVITKIDKVESDLLPLAIDEVKDAVKGTVFENSPLFKVDSLTGNGIEELKDNIFKLLNSIKPKNSYGSLFFPIDQSFHIHGIGTVVRGTIVEGVVSEQEEILIMPSNHKVQVKSIQHFNESVPRAYAGQRAALALKGVNVNEVKRGSVITNIHSGNATTCIDIELNVSPQFSSQIKQRSPIKLHTGTSEVYGKIIFFDRNKLEDQEVVYCQIQLDDPIYVLKDQRYILRRATPIETIGGGKIIEPNADKHRHGYQTVQLLKQKASFDENDYVLDIINQNPGITKNELHKKINYSISLENLIEQDLVTVIDNHLFLTKLLNNVKESIFNKLKQFHSNHPLIDGANKSEIVSELPFDNTLNKIVLEYFIKNNVLKQKQYFIALPEFRVELKEKDQEMLNQVMYQLKQDKLKVKPINEYLKQYDVSSIEEFKTYLLHQKYVIDISEELYIEKTIFRSSIDDLKQQTDASFSLKEAKECLGVSRKYLIPLLEKLDKLKITKRVENDRQWL